MSFKTNGRRAHYTTSRYVCFLARKTMGFSIVCSGFVVIIGHFL
ncbi:MAG: hypothetical protein RXR52_10015 [Paraburkholderia sp.]|jgi:hypothetical protein